MKTQVRRLAEQFTPASYNIHLAVDEATMTFTGKVIVRGNKIGKPSKRITLHQKDLKIIRAALLYHDKKGDIVKEVVRFNCQASYDELRIHTTETLYPGAYTIEVEYSGVITQPMNGMYPCTYQEDGEKKQIIATQFESHHAREVFPCIDEPIAKAVFHLSIQTRPDVTVLSNTPVKEQSSHKDFMITTFEPSPMMSTYLLAFVTGDLHYKEATATNGVTVRTYSTRDNVEFTDFALQTALRCIEFYEEYFSIPYPLAKCDLIALPDFASGAMENWGCITFREQCMLVDPAQTSVPGKQYVAMVVAHELAHMWFGNLVTMKWWTDLWLNEGFASWIEHLACDKLFPEWQMWTQFVVDEQMAALRLDALENTHPIEVPVHHPDEIRTIFDTISYSKGASIVNQLYAFIGPKAFQDGLNLYLTRHAYGNTETNDLWQALGESSGQDVKAFMATWTSKPGYPIIYVGFDGDSIILRQQRFYMVKPKSDEPHSEWHVPLLQDRLGEAAVLASAHRSLVPAAGNQPPFLNKDRRGFYRVAYEQSLLVQIAKLIDDNTLSALDRLGLLNDLFEASKSGGMSTTTTIDFLGHYKHESNAAVWDVIVGMLGSIRLVMGTDELREAIKPYVRSLCEAEYKRLGWEPAHNEPYFDTLLRPTILGCMASADHPEVIAKCNELFASALKKPEHITINPDLRGIVYVTVARLGDESTYDQLLSLYDITTLSEERLTICSALTSFRQPSINAKVLQIIRSDRVRLQDVSYWLAYSLMNHHARNLTWEWIKANWEWMFKSIGNDLSFARIPVYAARVFSDDEFTKDYEAFFSARNSPTLDRAYKQGLEMLEWQINWRTRDQKAVVDYFKKAQQTQ